MKAIVLDLETECSVDLKKSGLGPYAASPDLVIDRLGYVLVSDQGVSQVKVWHPDREDMPDDLGSAINDEAFLIVAFNVEFDVRILRTVVDVPSWEKRSICLAVQSRAALGIFRATAGDEFAGLNLDQTLRAMNSPILKDYDALAGSGYSWSGNNAQKDLLDDGDSIEAARDAYVSKDVEAHLWLFQNLPQLPQNFWDEYAAFLRVNNNGVPVNVDLVQKSHDLAEIYQNKLNDLVLSETGYRFSQKIKLQRWLADRGVKLENMQKDTVSKVSVENEKLNRVLQSIAEAGQVPVAKFAGFLDKQSDGLVKNSFTFAATQSGRSSSRGINLQNINRPELSTDEQSAMIDLIKAGYGIDELNQFFNPKSIFSSIQRAMIEAPKGFVFLDADFTAAEPNVAENLTGDPTPAKPYHLIGEKIFGYPIDKGMPEYTPAKSAWLGIGYGQQAKGLYLNIKKSYPKFTEAQAQAAIDGYAEIMPGTVRLRGLILGALKMAANGKSSELADGKLKIFKYGEHVFMQKPSGHCVVYHRAERSDTSYGKTEFNYTLYSPTIKEPDRTVTKNMHVGTALAHAVSSIARDYLFNSMVIAVNSGLHVVGHFHDELLVLCPDDPAEISRQSDLLQKAMQATPSWSDGLAMKAEVECWKFFRK